MLFWTDTEGFCEIVDPLEATDALISTGYFTLDHKRLGKLKIYNKVKYDFTKQRGAAADTRDDCLFLGMTNRADYPIVLFENVQLWPRWKSIFRKINPTYATDLATTEWSHFFKLTSKYFVMPITSVEYGIEFDVFRDMEDKPEVVPAGFKEDFNATVLAA